jgi:DNA-binding response OmpR family regulator
MSNIYDGTGPIRPLARRVLVVEDHADTLRAMVRLLTLDGFDVLPAGNVAQALNHLVLQPDYVITDLMLPDGDGVEVLRRARSRDESIVVAIWTAAGNELVRAATDAGPDVLFRKPVDFDVLRRWLKSNPVRTRAGSVPTIYGSITA